MFTKIEEFNKKDVELEKRELIIQQRENLVEQREKNLAAQAVAVERGQKNEAVTLTRLQKEETILSSKSLVVKAEDRILDLMTQFSGLGVDLDHLPHCSDPEERRRYHKAEAMYSEIVAVAEAHGLSQQYRAFINSIDSHRPALEMEDCVPDTASSIVQDLRFPKQERPKQR